MVAAETAMEQKDRDPRQELERTSSAAAKAVEADPEIVFQMADEIVVRTFRADLDKPGSLEFLCVSCGVSVPRHRLVCGLCAPGFLSDNEPEPPS
jgi:hypothetical protein